MDKPKIKWNLQPWIPWEQSCHTTWMPDLSETVWMKNVPCDISKQRTLQPTGPWPLQPPPTVPPEGTQDGKKQDTGPRELKCTSEEWFQWARDLQLATHKKALNSFTWGVWFSFINSNPLMFCPPGLCCKNSYTSWLSPGLYGAFTQSYWEAASRGCVLRMSAN